MKLMDAQLEQELPLPGVRERLMRRQRERLWKAFCAFREEGGGGTVLEVGAQGSPGSSWTCPAGMELTPCFLDLSRGADMNRYARNDGRSLLYTDGEFDWVFCDALLEHAGAFEHQFHLLAEMHRVAKKGLFITAANRRYPVDFATGMPLLHWLPGGVWRRITGQQRNLLTAPVLKRMASLLPGRPWFDVGHVRLAGPKAQLFLLVKKT